MMIEHTSKPTHLCIWRRQVRVLNGAINELHLPPSPSPGSDVSVCVCVCVMILHDNIIFFIACEVSIDHYKEL